MILCFLRMSVLQFFLCLETDYFKSIAIQTFEKKNKILNNHTKIVNNAFVSWRKLNRNQTIVIFMKTNKNIRNWTHPLPTIFLLANCFGKSLPQILLGPSLNTLPQINSCKNLIFSVSPFWFRLIHRDQNSRLNSIKLK